jgi:hypothetical protein
MSTPATCLGCGCELGNGIESFEGRCLVCVIDHAVVTHGLRMVFSRACERCRLYPCGCPMPDAPREG